MPYHIHPLTGQAQPCRAKKRCPFGDLVADHYATREEAQAAYEATWQAVPQAKLSYSTPLHLQEAVDHAAKQVATLQDPALHALGQSLLERLAQGQEGRAFADAVAFLQQKVTPGDGATRHLLTYFERVAEAVARDESQKQLEARLRKLEAEASSWAARGERLRAQGEEEASPALRECREEEAFAREAAAHERKRLSPESESRQARDRRACEKLRAALSGLSLSPRPRRALSAPLFRGGAFELYYVDDEASLRGKLAPEFCYHGRPSPGDYRQALAEATALGESFLQGASEGGSFTVPAPFDDDRGDYSPPPGLEARGFRYLSRGAEQVAYLHEESGLVVKVPLPASHLAPGRRPLEQEEVQQRYALVNAEALAAHDAEYVPTYFLSLEAEGGAPVSAVVQPYLPPGEYVPARADYLMDEQGLGVTDTHRGNVRRSLTTGKLLLFDCLY